MSKEENVETMKKAFPKIKKRTIKQLLADLAKYIPEMFQLRHENDAINLYAYTTYDTKKQTKCWAKVQPVKEGSKEVLQSYLEGMLGAYSLEVSALNIRQQAQMMIMNQNITSRAQNAGKKEVN